MWGAVLSNNAIHHHTGSKKIARAQAQPPAAPRHRALGQALGPQPRPGAAGPGLAGPRPRPRAQGHVLASMLAATRPMPRAPTH